MRRTATCIKVERGYRQWHATLELETKATVELPCTEREFEVGETYQLMLLLSAPAGVEIDLTKCRPAHEVWCRHRDGRMYGWRWTTVDSCSGVLCERCWWEPGSPREWRDLIAICIVDGDGIPIDKGAWTQADALGAMMRGT